MKVNGTHYRSIWYDHELSKVKIIAPTIATRSIIPLNWNK